MKHRKTLQELTIKDNFMFGAVMCDEKQCRHFLELALGFPIAQVKVDKEKSIVYHPQYKGVRLDVYAEDAEHTHYNVEMQAVKKEALPKRARYYHSQIDMELLLSGVEYSELSNSYVIFICDFDPFGGEKYRYTVCNHCAELNGQKIEDGSTTIFFSTHGKNEEEVPEALVKFLNFVRADLEESKKDFADDYVKSLQESVSSVKRSREMGECFMLLELMLQDERKEGKAEGLAEGIQKGKAAANAENTLGFLEDLGTVPEALRARIMTEQDPDTLKRWLKLSAKVDSVEQFESEM